MARKKILTLCFVQKRNELLLGMKKRGFGKGRWNGFGGKVETGESIEAAARREVLEEAGIVVEDLQKYGMLQFRLAAVPEEILEVHVFSTYNFSGMPQESEEMKPQWFKKTSLPFQTMWADDAHWMPFLLENKRFTGEFHFDEDQNITRHTLKEVTVL